jgi:translation initiation factor eIF-2B subunit beta
MALALAAASIETILVPDACIFALMSRVNKVILGAHAVLADGSFFGISGSLPVCRAAKAHLVPVIVCTGLYKLCPVFLGDDMGQLDDRSPDEVLETGGEELDLVQVKNPYYDKCSADLVALFITNAYVAFGFI